jgi:hypothetical protein
LRAAAYTPGIGYNEALVNQKKLRECEMREDEQRVELQNLNTALKQQK